MVTLMNVSSYMSVTIYYIYKWLFILTVFLTVSTTHSDLIVLFCL